MAVVHRPVLVREILDLLGPKEGGVYVDGTLGSGGHSLALLQRLKGNCTVIGIDRDGDILREAEENLMPFENQVVFFAGSFTEMERAIGERKGVDGIFLDLGVSSLQLDKGERGFSFAQEGPIDMRMDRLRGETALEKICRSNERELTAVLKEYGEERLAPKIARNIFEKLKRNALKTTKDLAAIPFTLYPPKQRYKRIHPATRTFQALRIWVNDELENLRRFLKEAPRFLNPQGRLCIISYHSLEDRIVKHVFRDWAKEKESFRILTKKPIQASEKEIEENRRARSAKLRGIERRV